MTSECTCLPIAQTHFLLTGKTVLLDFVINFIGKRSYISVDLIYCDVILEAYQTHLLLILKKTPFMCNKRTKSEISKFTRSDFGPEQTRAFSPRFWRCLLKTAYCLPQATAVRICLGVTSSKVYTHIHLYAEWKRYAYRLVRRTHTGSGQVRSRRVELDRQTVKNVRSMWISGRYCSVTRRCVAGDNCIGLSLRW